MTTHNHEKENPADDPAFSQSGYVYHRQSPPPRHRRAPATETVDPRKTMSQKQAARDVLFKNIRTFVAVLSVMIVILALAYIISVRTWKAKESRLLRPQPTLAAPLYRPVRRGMFDDRLPVAKAATNGFAFSSNLLEDYHRAFLVWSHLPNPWTEAGRSLMRMGDHRRAQHAFELALASEPNSVVLLNDLGVVYFQQKKIDRALTLFRMAVDTDATYSATYFNMTLCFLAKADRPRARSYLDIYLDLEPDDPRGLREKAALEAADQHYAEALELLQRAIRKSPKWPALYFDAAVISAALKKPEAAIAYLEKTMNLAPIPVVYRVYQEPVFKDVRLAPASKDFEMKLATRAREFLTSAQPEPAVTVPVNPPISSLSTLSP